VLATTAPCRAILFTSLLLIASLIFFHPSTLHVTNSRNSRRVIVIPRGRKRDICNAEKVELTSPPKLQLHCPEIMESANSAQSSTRPVSGTSPLLQHPLSPLFPPTTPDATQTIFLNHPALRISSSPAASPRIIDPPPERRGSVRPTMSKTMEHGLNPGADFFDDESSGSEWEDEEDVSQCFPAADGLGLGSLVHGLGFEKERVSRGRSRERNRMTALPSFHAPPENSDSGLGMSSPVDNKDTRRARPMSLRRLGRDDLRLVHNRSSTPGSIGTPRGSTRTNGSCAASSFVGPRRPPNTLQLEPSFSSSPRSVDSFRGHHRRNTSESMLAESIINAHKTTMRALEALSDSPTKSTSTPLHTFLRPSASTDLPKSTSFTNSRHIKLSPLTVHPNRPAHLAGHFIKTPYPFSARKEFPKPEQRPRYGELTRLDSGYDDVAHRHFDAKKGKHVLGLPTSGSEMDLRSRQERNEDAQGVFRTRAECGIEGQGSVVWLSLQRQASLGTKRTSMHRKLVGVDVPSNLTVSSPYSTGKKGKPTGDVEFDDHVFAQRLRAGYRQLAGNWFVRTFSAQKLRYIQLGQASMWSGAAAQHSTYVVSGLLAVGDGLDGSSHSRSPFTEDGLLQLYRAPRTGQARYTWVHWARRVAASNQATPLSPSSQPSTTRLCRRRTGSRDSPTQCGEKSAFSLYSNDDAATPHAQVDTITTIQFVHSLSTHRVLVALLLMLVLGVGVPVLWILFGPPGTDGRVEGKLLRSDRVGPAMAVGILTLLVEGLGFGAWIWWL